MKDEYLENEYIWNIRENVGDFDEMQIIYALIDDQLHRLQGDLDNKGIAKEYNTLTTIQLQIKDIIDNYC